MEPRRGSCSYYVGESNVSIPGAHDALLLSSRPFPASELADRGLSREAIDFIQKVMTVEATDRMTSKEGLLHDWMMPMNAGQTSTSRLSLWDSERYINSPIYMAQLTQLQGLESYCSFRGLSGLVYVAG